MTKKKIDLNIDTKYNVNSKSIVVHPNLMKVPFYLTEVGGKQSGKTLLTANIVHKYKKIFKNGNIYIFTNSYVPTLQNLTKSREAHIFNSLYDSRGNDILESILEYQREQKKEDYKNLDHLLIIFDDFISNDALNQRRGIFTKLWSMARNFNISLIITSQEYMLVPAPLRKMSDYFIVFKIRNTKEKQQMISECQNFLNETDFVSVYQEATKEKYNFLFCMVDEMRMLKNFKTELASEKIGV